MSTKKIVGNSFANLSTIPIFAISATTVTVTAVALIRQIKEEDYEILR